MPPFYRFAEICLYSLLNFLPFLVLAIYPFRKHLRFPVGIVCALTCILTVAQFSLGIWAAFFSGGKANIISAVSTLLYAVFYFLAVRMPLGKTLFTLMMLSNTANLIVIVSKCIEGRLFPALALQSYRWSFSLIMFCVEAIIWVPLFIYIKKVYTPAVEKEPSGKEWRYLWLIPATFYLIWYYHIYGSTASSLEIALRPRNTLFLIAINTGAFLIYFIVAQLVLEQNKNTALQESNHRLEMQNLQYDSLQAKIMEARRAKHDVRHHIALMQKYLKDKNYDGLEAYLDRYRSDLPDDSLLTFCENPAVNTVLMYFAQRAKENNVEFTAGVSLPARMAISETDLSVLFGNLLENALDACIADRSDPKKILVNARIDRCALWLTVDNSFTGTLKTDRSGALLSQKPTGSGLGIPSVRAIAEKYHGGCRFHADGKMFYASVMLNQEEGM